MSAEFVNDGKFIFINTAYAEAYIPDELFVSPNVEETTSSIAFDTGDQFETIGIFYMRFFNDENAPRESTKVRTLNYPNPIVAHPSGKTTKENLTINGVTDKYRVYRFYKGDILMESISKKSPVNVEMFTNLVMAGKVPSSLSYDDIYASWLRNFRINGVSPDIPPVLMQAIVARLCRVKDDPNTFFRFKAGSGKAGPHDYRMLNVNQVSQHSSVMSSLSFERFAESLTNGVYMSRTGIEQEPSPLEKILTL